MHSNEEDEEYMELIMLEDDECHQEPRPIPHALTAADKRWVCGCLIYAALVLIILIVATYCT